MGAGVVRSFLQAEQHLDPMGSDKRDVLTMSRATVGLSHLTKRGFTHSAIPMNSPDHSPRGLGDNTVP